MISIHESELGKTTRYYEQYTKSLLFRIPRAESRLLYGIDPQSLPFCGFDVWNAYEISFLTNNRLPVARVLKLIYPAESTYLVESKSLKLYLNSLNMECCGATIDEAEQWVINTITRDLNALLETNVQVKLFRSKEPECPVFDQFSDLTEQLSLEEWSGIQCNHFNETPSLLIGKKVSTPQQIAFRSDLLRSNCPVTNQPDWGDLFLTMTSNYEVNLSSIVSYLVSFRKENHFHEEVVEMIFSRLLEAFQPAQLMVAAMFTRRGGIDINPIRATHAHLIPPVFSTCENRIAKTWRQ